MRKQREQEERVKLAALRYGCPPEKRRQAYIDAISVILCARPNDDDPIMDDIANWLWDLNRDLRDLEMGIVAPALRCETGSNMRSTNEWEERVSSVALTEELRLLGHTYQEAARLPANLHNMFSMPDELVTEKDIIGWCREFRKGRVKNRRAVQNYDAAMSHLGDLKKAGDDELIRKSLLQQLEDLQENIRRYFPSPDAGD
jgi:hypothetical protein